MQEFERDIKRRGCDLSLGRMDVFSFGISQRAKTFKELSNFANINNDEIDYALFHHANLILNKMIIKKGILDKEKVPYSFKKFENTSSTLIPVTIVTELVDKLIKGTNKLLFLGFELVLISTFCHLETENIKILNLIKV
jgi:3-oxoacyl-[acyl-carrier-protein] synthase-3